jgi:hypothetical protein
MHVSPNFQPTFIFRDLSYFIFTYFTMVKRRRWSELIQFSYYRFKILNNALWNCNSISFLNNVFGHGINITEAAKVRMVQFSLGFYYSKNAIVLSDGIICVQVYIYIHLWIFVGTWVFKYIVFVGNLFPTNESVVPTIKKTLILRMKG